MTRFGAYEILHELKSGGMGAVLLGRRKGPGAFEQPHWNSRPSDTRFAAANFRIALDARPGRTNVLSGPLKELRFFRARHLRKQISGRFKSSAHRGKVTPFFRHFRARAR